MISLSENPAIADPARALSADERKALIAIGFYRHRSAAPGGGLRCGPVSVSTGMIGRLKAKSLIKGDVPAIALTHAGSLAYDKLRAAGKEVTRG